MSVGNPSSIAVTVLLLLCGSGMGLVGFLDSCSHGDQPPESFYMELEPEAQAEASEERGEMQCTAPVTQVGRVTVGDLYPLADV